MCKALKHVSLGTSVLLFVCLFASGAPAAEATGKPVTKAPVLSQEQQIADAMRKLGFAVESAKPLENGDWEVRISGFDVKRANEASRGAILAPVAGTAGTRNAPSARDMGISGRGGPLGPRGGGNAVEQDGSATGGGNSGSDNGSDGGSATGGGKDDKPEKSTNPRHQGAALKVSVAADGTLIVDANSLRKAGYINTLGSTSNGRVIFR